MADDSDFVPPNHNDFSPPLEESWLEQLQKNVFSSRDPLVIWGVRILVTLLIAAFFHWYTNDNHKKKEHPTKSRTLMEEETTSKSEQQQTLLLLYDELEEADDENTENDPPEEAIQSIQDEFVVVDRPHIIHTTTDACTQTYPSAVAENKQSTDDNDDETKKPVILIMEDACTQTLPSAAAGDKTSHEEEKHQQPEQEESVVEEEEAVVADDDEPKEEKEQQEKSHHEPTTTTISRTPIKAISDKHPGLDAFYYWYNVETSLYRIYELGRSDNTPVICPFLPKSERGQTKINLRVTNQLSVPFEVFWVDYYGKEVSKGTIYPGGLFVQTTWIGHPWTFRLKDGGDVLLHYIPYRVIPTTKSVPTVESSEPSVGVHQFSILPFIPGTPYTCRVVDPVLPHPPQYSLETPMKAAKWTLQHMERTQYYDHHMAGLEAPLLLKYLTKIVAHPDQVKYRQIRTAQRNFSASVWNTAARGLLLACGFVEEQAYAELGTEEPLSSDRVSDVSLLLMTLEQWKSYQERQYSSSGGSSLRQPDGADGFGRASFGRAGAMG